MEVDPSLVLAHNIPLSFSLSGIVTVVLTTMEF